MSNEEPKKTAIYIRVSTVYQIDKDSLPMQRRDLVAYSELILGIPDYEVFEDAGYSGKNTDRPAFQEMMRRVRAGEFSHLLVWKIDRISRNLLDFSEMYQELRRLRVVFVSKNEQFDTSTAIGEAMLKIILVFAELERNMTSERVYAAMRSRAASGDWNGGRVPFGYQWDKEKKELSIEPDEAAICRLIRDDYLENKSITHTSKLLNDLHFRTRAGKEWSAVSVHKIISSPFYTGTYQYGMTTGPDFTPVPSDEWIVVPDHHPAIFTEEEYKSMSEIRSDNSRLAHPPLHGDAPKVYHVFANVCFCGKCGSRLWCSPGRKHKDGYITGNYSCPKARKSKECDNRTVNDLIIGEFTINYILNMLNAKKAFSTLSNASELERRLLRGQTFSHIKEIEISGLNEFFDLLSNYSSDESFFFAPKKKKRVTVSPEISALKKERGKLERALKRLHNLYLYSEKSMTEADYLREASAISSRLEEINTDLGMLSTPASSTLSDEDFIRQASHLLISSQLSDKTYVYYKDLVQSVSPEVLSEYVYSIIDHIEITDGHVSALTFKNGLTHRFISK